MATFDYQALKDEVEPLLEEFGDLCQLSRDVPGTVDPVSGIPSGDATEVTDVHAVVVDYEAKLVDGVTIMRYDRMAIVQAVVEPVFGDQFIEHGVTWAVVHVQAVKPASLAIIYILQIRR